LLVKALSTKTMLIQHKYSWLTRPVNWGTSWVAPVDVRRVETSLTDNQIGSLQVRELAQRDPKPRVVVADSLYGNHLFRAVLLELINSLSSKYLALEIGNVRLPKNLDGSIELNSWLPNRIAHPRNP
jgi:hypothetical protein